VEIALVPEVALKPSQANFNPTSRIHSFYEGITLTVASTVLPMSRYHRALYGR